MTKKAIAALFATAAFAASCTSVPKALKTPSLTDYYPLKKGMSWTYRALSFEKDTAGEPTVLITRVAEEQDGVFVLVQGDSRIKYRYDDNGLLKVKSGAYAIKKPILTGASWPISVGGVNGTARILETASTVAAGSHSYERCLIIEDVYPKVARHVSWYCPPAGLVKFEEYELHGSREVLLNRVELLAFGPAEEAH
ncbi:MAG: hypothetical protein WC889_06195 [Myxococcota bacterium]|jgi:hypothetical protein